MLRYSRGGILSGCAYGSGSHGARGEGDGYGSGGGVGIGGAAVAGPGRLRRRRRPGVGGHGHGAGDARGRRDGGREAGEGPPGKLTEGPRGLASLANVALDTSGDGMPCLVLTIAIPLPTREATGLLTDLSLAVLRATHGGPAEGRRKNPRRSGLAGRIDAR